MLVLFLILQIGVVKIVEGDVVLTRGDEEMPLYEGMKLERGDIVKVKKGGQVLIKLDGGELRVLEMSQVELSKEVIAGDSKIETLVGIIKIVVGKIRVWSKGKLNILSPTAVLGVKATKIRFAVAPDMSVLAEVEEGEVIFVAEKPLILKEGRRIIWDVIEGAREESTEKLFEFKYEERVRRYNAMRDEILKKVNELMAARLKFYEESLSRAYEQVGKLSLKEMAPELFKVGLLRSSLKFGLEFLKTKGIAPGFEKRLKEIEHRWYEFERKVQVRFEKKRREVERKFEKKVREIEDKFKKFEEKF